MKRNILITGGTGFLGRELVNQLSFENKNNIVVVGQSELRIQHTKNKFKNVICYCLDISHNKNNLDSIIKKHNIEYIIHCAAMKHVGICENNSYRSVDVNVIGSKNIIDLYSEHNLKNVIGISTDKAINPTCVYGTTKYLMEKMFLEKGCSIFQGVNFLFSEGSVLDVWEKQRIKKEKLGINTKNTLRYFTKIEDVATLIIQNLDVKRDYFYPEKCYKIRLHDLAKAFCEYHNYCHVREYTDFNVEKLEEEISPTIEIVDTTVEDIKILLHDYYQEGGAHGH